MFCHNLCSVRNRLGNFLGRTGGINDDTYLKPIRSALLLLGVIGGGVYQMRSVEKGDSRMQIREKQIVDPVDDKEALRIMSYNIRMAPVKEDERCENAWKHRLPKIGLIFTTYCPDIVGVQEVSTMQAKTLVKTLHPFGRASYEIAYRVPTRAPIESGLGIVFNAKRLKRISKLNTLWLNEKMTSAQGRAWDGSSYERYIVYAQFEDHKTGKKFWFLTTHFDHLGVKARSESAKIVMDLAKSLDGPVIATGDYNCFPQLGGKELYELLCSHYPAMVDSHDISHRLFGVPGSWMGWDYDPFKQTEGFAKYDYVFVKGVKEVLQHGVIDDRVFDPTFGRELYPSDHRPVLSDLKV